MGLSRRGMTRDLSSFVAEIVTVSDIYVVYQPILDLNDGSVFAYEALLRSNDPRYKSPPVLIQEAIDRKCCGELGRLIRGLALSGCPDHRVFLNIHPVEFDDRWLVQPDDPIFTHEHPIFLEITESVPMSHEASCHSTLREIRSKDIMLAVDDLGAGYSNLKSIADLSPEVVKLDRELVQGISTDERVFKLVKAVTKLCSEMGAKVVGEGVETKAELDGIKAAGCHFGQGYYFARPGPLPKKKH